MSKPEVVLPPGSQKSYERFQFAPAVRVGDMVYCSGVIGTDGQKVPDEAAAEFAKAFLSLADVLAAAGGSLDDVVEMTTFHVDMNQHLGDFMSAKGAAIKQPYPAWTAIGCSELAIPGARVEIKAMAYIPTQS